MRFQQLRQSTKIFLGVACGTVSLGALLFTFSGRATGDDISVSGVPGPTSPIPREPSGRPIRISDPAAIFGDTSSSDETPIDKSTLDKPPLDKSPSSGRPLNLTPNIEETGPDDPPLHTETTTFNGVRPGVSGVLDLADWGEPRAVRAKLGGEVRIYDVPQFKRVEVSISDSRVNSIVVHFDKLFSSETVSRQLKLGEVRSVAVVDDSGAAIGLSFPERGVTFNYAKDKQPAVVAQVLLETIEPVPFVLRAENDVYLRPKNALADLNQALSLDPKLDHALWLKAEVLLSVGRYRDSLQAIEDALAIDSESLDYRLSRARILESKGEWERAIADMKQILEMDGLSPSAKAHTNLRLGNCLGAGAKPDYKQALAAHIAAIKLAEPLTKEDNVVIRRNAKQILADAYLGAGHDIAWGAWQQKSKVVPQWLEKSGVQVEDILSKEAGDGELRLRYFHRALAACAGEPKELNGDELINKALQTGQQLLAATEDPWRKQRIEWEIGLALFEAHRIAQAKGQAAKVAEYAEQAVSYLERGGRNRQVSHDEEYSLGKLYYRVGAVRAIRRKDHVAAVKWYDKAAPLMDRATADIAPADLAQHGEIMVSMGVSYWEIGKKEEALRLTTTGAEVMNQAVEAGLMPATAMSVPYGNLSSMHKALGDERQAGEFEELASKSVPPNGPKRK